MKDIIKAVLTDYVDFIRGFKDLIYNQSIDEENLYGTSGVIDDYKFRYHGAGCRLEKKGTICEYDFLPENGFPIKFSSWKLQEFINTSEKWRGLDCGLEDLHESLLCLVEEKMLLLLELGGVQYPVFQVKDLDNFFKGDYHSTK